MITPPPLPLHVPARRCGVQCPSMGRRAAAAEAEGENGTVSEPQPEPGAREAKLFTESRVLNREVGAPAGRG